MISDFREGGRFSKIRESHYKKAFGTRGKSEIGGRAHCSKVIGKGGQNVPDLLEQNQ